MNLIPLISAVLFIAPSGVYAAKTEQSALWTSFMKSDLVTAVPEVEFPYEECFKKASEKNDLPMLLLLAVARGESDFDPKAVSSANAKGLMQILWPGTANHLGIYTQKDIFDPCTNVDAGARYLNELLDRYNGDLHLALAAYNYGPGRISAAAKEIPKGAEWYSRYIYGHMNFIAGLVDSGVESAIRTYDQIKKIPLVVFLHPWLAERFVQGFGARAPNVRLEVFKTYFSQYRVMLLYQSDKEYRRSKKALNAAGFRLEDPK